MEIPHDQFIAAFSRLPVSVREFMSDDELPNLMQELGKKYSLHVDVLGNIESLVGYMVIGVMSPTQFVGELQLLGIEHQTINNLVNDLNERLFKPLREKFKSEIDAADSGTTVKRETLVPTPAPFGMTQNFVPAPPNPTIVERGSYSPINLPGAITRQQVPEPMQTPSGQNTPTPAPSFEKAFPQQLQNPQPMPQATPAPTTPMRPVMKEYGIDPYRETPE